MYLLDVTAPHLAKTFPVVSQHTNPPSWPYITYLANSAYTISTKPDLVMYNHRAIFSPVPSTFIDAIKMATSPLDLGWR